MSLNQIDNNKVNRYKQVDEYNLMKIIATILVVLGHSTYLKFGGVDYSLLFAKTLEGNCGQKIQSIVDIIYIFHMPLFFAISGAVYYIQKNKFNKYTSIGELISAKIKRLLIPYILVGLLYVIPIKLISRYYSINYTYVAIFYEMINGIGHLWFLFTLFWLFIIFYILEKYIYQKNKYIFLIIILSTYLFKDIIYEFIPSGLKNQVQYLIFFCIGYFFEIIREKYNKYKYIHINTLILGGLAYSIYYIQTNVSFRYVQCFLLLIVQLILILIVYNISYLSIKYLKVTCLKLYHILNKYNFEIYLFHDPLNYLILYITSLIMIKISNQNILQSQLFSFTLIVILRIIMNICICICIAILVKKFRKYKNLKKNLLYCCLLLFVLAFGVVIYNNYNNIHPVNEVYTPQLNRSFATENLTDENWKQGVSNTSNTLLFSNDEFNKKMLKNAKALKKDTIIKKIKNIKEIDSSWIYVELENRESIEEFEYPNVIEVINDI